jgi:5-methyltetrahydrofolate--homocysteine methyltransferase
VCLIEALGAAAVGLNCGLGPAQMKSLLPELIKYASIPVIINPNAGMPEQINGKTHFRVTPGEFAADMADIAAQARIIGGCCGTTPTHIEAMIAACRGIPPAPVTPKNHTVVSSYGKAVLFSGRTIIIGERINPTGKPRMKRALHDNDMEYIYREGLEQTENGAEILDVNVGLPGIDEKETLARAGTGLQSVTDAVLQIDTADAAAAERALRLYNGKPLLNSVSGKKESLETILPLVKKYGAAVVALTLDDNGIPANAADRVRIAETIIASAAKYGIPGKDIVFDTLTMTVSTDKDNAKITLEAMDHIRNKIGLHTVLGVSNISFGLPEREKINAAFFTLAMSRGLSAGIVNPMNTAIMDAFYAYNALSGDDANCAGYIERVSKQISPTTAPVTHNAGETISLYDAVTNGLR